MKLKYQITDNELDTALLTAFKKLYTDDEDSQSYQPWFDTEEQAEKWAGDIAADFVMNVIEALGIELIGDEDE